MAAHPDPGRGTPAAAVVAWTVPDPPHPLWQLTTFELGHYLTLLEAVRSVAPASHPVQDDVADMIDEVRAEQDERRQEARETRPDGTWGCHGLRPGENSRLGNPAVTAGPGGRTSPSSRLDRPTTSRPVR